MDKVLIVEDEEVIRLGLKDNFELEGYDVAVAVDGEEAITIAESFKPQLIILDLMLPKKSGYEVCRYLRKKMPTVFIIMLTAKTDESSILTGLEMGADDYVRKPFSILELLARSKSFIRRDQLNSSTENTISFNGIFIDFKRFIATKDQVPIDLNTKEFQIMKYFSQRKSEVVLREDILQDVWGYDIDAMPTTRTVDNHIVKLRQKLEANPSQPEIILSIRGAGYKFDV
ncbi:MAG: response regulator transcription factor [Fibrobacterales bacterium]